MDSPNGTLYYSEKVSKALQGVTPPPEFESSAFGIYQSLFRWLFLGGEELSENEKHSLLETERIEHSLGEGIRWVTEKGKNVCAVYGGLDCHCIPQPALRTESERSRVRTKAQWVLLKIR